MPEFRETEMAASELGMWLRRLEVDGPEDFERAFEVAAREGIEALTILSAPPTIGRHIQLAELTTAKRLPTMSHDSRFAQVGGFMAYGPNIENLWRRSAVYVDKILKGAKPADLPVEQPTKFDFAINLKTAQALGLTIPPHVLMQATEIIQ